MSQNHSFPKLPIVVFISGRGSNLVAIHKEIVRGNVPAEIRCVISSSKDAGGLAFAKENGIPGHWLEKEDFRNEGALSEKLSAILDEYNPALLVLAGFLRKIPEAVVTAFKNRIINVHPALLPAFGGKGMYGKHVHKAVLDYGCKVSGATVHIVSAEYDTGPPIIQQTVPVLDDDSPETLAERILFVEHRILPKAVDLFARNRIKIIGRKVMIES